MAKRQGLLPCSLARSSVWTQIYSLRTLTPIPVTISELSLSCLGMTRSSLQCFGFLGHPKKPARAFHKSTATKTHSPEGVIVYHVKHYKKYRSLADVVNIKASYFEGWKKVIKSLRSSPQVHVVDAPRHVRQGVPLAWHTAMQCSPSPWQSECLNNQFLGQIFKLQKLQHLIDKT